MKKYLKWVIDQTNFNLEDKRNMKNTYIVESKIKNNEQKEINLEIKLTTMMLAGK